MERTFSISLLNEVEDLDADQIEDFYDSDDDGDGFSDSVEIAYDSDPEDPNSLASTAPDSLELNGSTLLSLRTHWHPSRRIHRYRLRSNSSLTFSLVDEADPNTINSLRFTKIKSFALFIPWITKPMHDLSRTNSRNDPYAASLEGSTISLHNVIEDFDQDGIEDHFDPDVGKDGFSNLDETELGTDPSDPTPQSTPASSLFPHAPSLKIFRLAVTTEFFRHRSECQFIVSILTGRRERIQG